MSKRVLGAVLPTLTFVLVLSGLTHEAAANPVTIHDPMPNMSAIIGSAQMDDDPAEEIAIVFADERLVIVDSATGQKQFDSDGWGWTRIWAPGFTRTLPTAEYPNFNYGFDAFVDDDGDGIFCLMTIISQDTFYEQQVAVICPDRQLPTSVADDEPALSRSTLTLEQNVPNPFNPSTEIAFDLPRATRANLKIYDARGRVIATLVDEFLNAGEHRTVWDGRDDTGQPVASGTYHYRLEADGEVRTGKSVLLK